MLTYAAFNSCKVRDVIDECGHRSHSANKCFTFTNKDLPKLMIRNTKFSDQRFRCKLIQVICNKTYNFAVVLRFATGGARKCSEICRVLLCIIFKNMIS